MKFKHVLEQYPDATESPTGWWNGVPCPACGAAEKFGFRESDSGGWAIVKCFKECPTDDIEAALGQRVAAVFDFEDESGAVVAQRLRIEYAHNIDSAKGKPHKDFLPYRIIDGVRAEKPGLDGLKLSWYRRSEVRSAAEHHGVVWIVEGEAKADKLRAALREAGRDDAVTSPPGGSVTPAMAREIRGAGQAIVLGDNDETGRAKAAAAAHLAAAEVPDVRLIEALPNVQLAGDIADWLDAGGTVPELLGLVDAAQVVVKAATPAKRASSPVSAVMETRNDLGNAAWFLHLYADVARYNRDRQKWFFWDGKRWRADRGNDAMKFAKAAIKAMMRQAVERDDADLIKYALKCGRYKALDNMLKVAQSDDRVDRGQADFDADTWLLNVNNGTINLRTGVLRPHDPNDLITTLIQIDYDPSARSELWERTLLQVFEGRDDTVRYFQRATGYSMTGDVRHECFFLLYGTGRNGKGTVIETLQELLREYRRTTQFETFLKKRYPGAINNEFAELAGARIVVASESEGGRSFSAGVIKNLTGGDEVTTRFLYQNLFTYKPVFKIWLITNFKPAVDPDDEAFWERCKVIPFRHTFSAAERDETLKKRLKAAREQQGVLTWAVEGCLAWQRDGIGSCPDVDEGTKEYRAENDLVQQWIDADCITGEGLKADVSALTVRFDEWCGATGVPPWKRPNATAFGLRLNKQFPKDPRGKTRFGIGLRARQHYEAGDGAF